MFGKNNKRGIIASVQGFDNDTTRGIAIEAIRGGAIAIRTDKYIECPGVPLIGLSKRKVNHPTQESYITDSIEAIQRIGSWADLIAIDYRKINKKLPEINKYVTENKILVIADIGEIEDYENIMENDYRPYLISTAFRIFHRAHYFDFDFLKELLDFGCDNIIAEGNIKTRENVRRLCNMGIKYICIGSAMTDIYKLTKKFTSAYGEKEERIEK